MLTTIFNLLAIFYIFRGLQIARMAWQDRQALRDGAFSQRERYLADQASFFLAVPVAVFFHELSHALAVWAFGGRVTEFGYRVFWGFVVPSGSFTLAQDWFIALAGTLGSLLFGLVVWLLLRHNPAPAYRFFALRAFRYQIMFSIIYYPLFTLFGFYGDWRTIYDFSSTPILSGITAAAHATLLGVYIWLERSGWFEMASFQSDAQRQQFGALEAEAAANPHDGQAQLRLIVAYRQAGLKNQAKRQVEQLLKNQPRLAEAHLELALLEAQGKRQVPGKARREAEQALSLGLANPAAVAYAHQLLGHYSLGVGRAGEAVDHFGQGLAAAQSAGRLDMAASLSYLRATAYRRLGDYEAAYRDAKQAISWAEASGQQGPALASYRQELETIERHAGRQLEPRSASDDHQAATGKEPGAPTNSGKEPAGR